MRLLLLTTVLAAATQSAGGIRDVDGNVLQALVPSGRVGVLFFLTTDCPVSNAYAPEIGRVCRDYRARGVSCALFYEDVSVTGEEVRRHRTQFGLSELRAAIDTDRTVANAAGADVTPTAAVVDAAGRLRYRGRIDDLYVAPGRTRRAVTEHYLRDALEATLANRPVTTLESPPVGCHIVRGDLLDRLRRPDHANH